MSEAPFFAVAAVAAQNPATPPPAAQFPPTNDAPNPFETIEGWAKMPAGREWGSTSAVDIDKDGRSIWVAERCGKNAGTGRATNRCLDRASGEWSPLDAVMKFDQNGNMVKSFGAKVIIFPHGIHVDRDGNIWVTDGHDNFPAGPGRGRGAAPDAPAPPPPPPPDKPVGHQIFKFSPDGKVLMTLGKAGGNRPGQPADPASFYQPNDVITNDRGDIFVVEGHGDNSAIQRLSKFDRTGTFLKETGTRGNGPGQFIQPHALAWDSKGRLFVADRSNNRIQIYDQDLNLLDTGWEQYSRISGLWIDRNDMTVRGRLGVWLDLAASRRLEAGHPHRQRPGRQERQDPVLHPRSVHGHERDPGGRRRRGGRCGQYLRRRGRTCEIAAIRSEEMRQ